MRELSSCSPLVTMCFYILVLSVSMFTENPVIAGISLLASLLFFCLTDKKGGFRQHLFFLGLGLLMALINPLFYHNGVTVLFVMNDNPVTLEALLYGIHASVKILASLYWFRSFSLLMTEDRLLYCLGSVSPKTALLLSMAIRYIPLFRNQTRKVEDAQRAIGLYREENLIDRVMGGLKVFNIMVTWALENGIVTADSMTARGYGTGRRTYFSLYRFTRGDAVLLCLILVPGITSIVLMLTGAGKTVFYPEIVMASASGLTLVFYLLFGLLALLPSALLLEERISWRYYLSKI